MDVFILLTLMLTPVGKYDQIQGKPPNILPHNILRLRSCFQPRGGGVFIEKFQIDGTKENN